MYELFRAVMMSLSLAIICLAFVARLWQDPLGLTVVLILLSGAALWLHKRKEEFLLYIIISIGGPVAEIIAIYFGAWSYGAPQVWGIPLWLPPLWGLAGLLTKWSYDELMIHYRNAR